MAVTLIFSDEAPRNAESDTLIFSKDDLAVLKRQIAGLVRVAADDQTLLEKPDLRTLLYVWWRWGDSRDAVVQWVHGAVSRESDLIRFLEVCVTIKGVTDAIAGKPNAPWFEEYISLPNLSTHARALLDVGSLTEKQREIIQSFVEQYSSQEP